MFPFPVFFGWSEMYYLIPPSACFSVSRGDVKVFLLFAGQATLRAPSE